MRLQVYRPPDIDILWRINQFGRQSVPAGRTYWWENPTREPPGQIILQATYAGSIILRQDGSDRPVRPGDLMLFAYGEPTAYGSPEPVRETYQCAWVGLRGAGVAEHFAAFRQRHGDIHSLGLDSPLLAEFSHLVTAADPRSATPAHQLATAAYAFVMRLFEHAEHGRTQTLTPVEQAIEHILRQPHLPLSLEQVAQRFGCSREHLSRSFQERVGQPPAAYLADARRRRALRLLRETDLPLAAIAAQSGYATPHTLARHIRQATGLSPTTLRAHRHAPPSP